MAEICGLLYYRDGTTIPCTYIKGHPTERHSWETLKVQDEADAAAAQAWRSESTPDDIRVLLANIKCGNADPYLEAILAVTHNRKRQLRGTRGFDDLMQGL